MDYEKLGYAMGQLMGSLFMIGLVVFGIVAIVRAARTKPQPSAAPYWAAAFGLSPGEYFEVAWPAAHTLGHPMVATITSHGIFALNHRMPQSPPLRLGPHGVTVTVGSTQKITVGTPEPMVDVTLAVAGSDPQSFLISRAGADALVAWAIPAT